MKLGFSRRIVEKYSKFMKIRLMGVELFHADGRSDITKLIVAFRDFAKSPKNELSTKEEQWQC